MKANQRKHFVASTYIHRDTHTKALKAKCIGRKEETKHLHVRVSTTQNLYKFGRNDGAQHMCE